MSRRIAVVTIAILAIIGFAAAAAFYSQSSGNQQASEASGQTPAPATELLVRPYSPVIGPPNAPVTIVEFFDPSCEACRAMHPFVKQIMAQYPNDVRLVIRYAPLHPGSETAIRILETARAQGVFVPVLDAVLAAQPEWHDDSGAGRAWTAAAAAGLDLGKARQTMMSPQITANLNQDVADLQAVGIEGTPTFFVNGKRLDNFGPEQLSDLVRAEVEAARQPAV